MNIPKIEHWKNVGNFLTNEVNEKIAECASIHDAQVIAKKHNGEIESILKSLNKQ